MLTKLKNRFNILYESLKTSVRRFPETAVVSLAIVILGIMFVHTPYDQESTREFLEKILLTLVLGIPLLSTGKLIVEKWLSNSQRLIVDLAIIAFLGVFYYFIPETLTNQFGIKYALLTLSAYLGFTLVPYFYNRDRYSLYFLKLITHLAATFLFSLVLFLGLNAIILTIEQLFEVSIVNEIHGDIAIVIAGLFAPMHILGKIPMIDEEMPQDFYPTVLKVLFSYIIIPLLTIYTGILYAYFIRLIIIREFPINLLGHLVVWYGIISVVVLFFINKIKEEKGFLSTFYRYFPMAIMIPLGMLFLAIGSRIMDFGFTPPRYFVLITGVWILGNMLYIFFSKQFKSTMLVITAIAVLLVSAYGPQSAFSVSLRNQENRFEELLVENELLVDGAIVANPSVDEAVKEEVTTMLRYFNEYHTYEAVDVLPEGYERKAMEDVFGFSYTYAYQPRNNYINYSYMRASFGTDISDYNYLIYYNGPLDENNTYTSEEIQLDYSHDSHYLEIIKADELLGRLDVEAFIRDYHEKMNGQQPQSIEEATEIVDLETIELKIIIRNLNVELDSDDLGNGYFELTILIKEK